MILKSMTACRRNIDKAAMPPMVTNSEIGSTTASQQVLPIADILDLCIDHF